ncbi:MAG: SAM-dependent methyltransferase [Phycisphaerales bacterium]
MPRERKLHDHYFKMAKEEGYAARSAYKLLQINERRRIVRRGMHVLDLGCAPGSWLQVASEAVGQRGCVVGLDLQAVTIPLPAHAIALVGDAFNYPVSDLALAMTRCGIAGGDGRFDVLLSDMAPNTTGAGDHFRSVALCRRVLQVAPELLAPGGSLVMKVFEGSEYIDLLRETGRVFDEAKGYKPQATREVSTEMFIIATGFSGGAGPAAPAKGTGNKHAIAKAPPAPKPGWGRDPGPTGLSPGRGGRGGGGGGGA